MIYFHFETEAFELNQVECRSWVGEVAREYSKTIDEVNYVFCDDTYLLDLNIKYLKHSTLTDIISFDNSQGDELSGDIFVSTERVRENAKKYAVSFENELRRVMIHGILHFIGFKDKTEEERSEMRKAEDQALKMLTQ